MCAEKQLLYCVEVLWYFTVPATGRLLTLTLEAHALDILYTTVQSVCMTRLAFVSDVRARNM